MEMNESDERQANIDNEGSQERDDEIDTNVHFLKNNNKKLYFIIEGASLELTNSKKHPQIINWDEHFKIISKMNKTSEDYRPDIIHQCLLSLFDSPLNKVGMLQVYIHTRNDALIEINPRCRIPRTFKRFCGLFSTLLNKREIIAAGTNEVLMRVDKRKVREVIGKIPVVLLAEKGKLVDIDAFSENLNQRANEVAFVVGSSNEDVTKSVDYMQTTVSISSYDLTSSVVCAKICNAFEKVWNVL